MITDGKRLNIEQYTSSPNSNSQKTTILPDTITSPQSPLSQALKQANIPMVRTIEDQYFVNHPSGNHPYESLLL